MTQVDESLRAKGEMFEALKSLNTNDAFQYLKSTVTKKRQRLVEGLATRILNGDPINETFIAYERGYWDGAMHVLNRPENAEEAFTKALKRLEEGTTE